MLIRLSTTTFDPLGVIELNVNSEQSDFGEARRRVTRIATLDGGAVFNDFGLAQADKTITLVWAIASKAQSVPTGIFLAAPEAYASTQSTGTLTLLVKSKLSGD